MQQKLWQTFIFYKNATQIVAKFLFLKKCHTKYTKNEKRIDTPDNDRNHSE